MLPAFRIAMLLVAGATSVVVAAEPVAFEPLPKFPSLPAEMELGPCSAVAVNSQGEIFLFNRGKRPIIAFDKEGKYLRSWGEQEIVSSHGLRVDRDDNLWATDWQGHRVVKYDSQGKVLLALGDGKPGASDHQFNQPTDVAFGPKGEFYVSDGYGNSRVLKFSPSGALITKWGTKGTKAGEFHLPHAIVVDGKGRVLVGDRENNRIQVFDADGKFLEMWRGFAPYGIAVSAQGEIFVADGRTHRVLQLNEKGAVVQRIGSKGTQPGRFQLPHMLTVDGEGNLLIAEVEGKRVQKLVRKK